MLSDCETNMDFISTLKILTKLNKIKLIEIKTIFKNTGNDIKLSFFLDFSVTEHV